MTLEALLRELRKPDRADNLRAMQMLVTELSAEEGFLTGTEYEVWSPYDTHDAAAILMNMLQQDRKQHE